MSGFNYLPIAGVTVGGFVFSSVWYVIFGKQRGALSDGAAARSRPPARLVPVELFRKQV